MHDSIIESIDKEIARLSEIRALLAGSGSALNPTKHRGRGRPKGSKNIAKVTAPKAPKRGMSLEGRARIGAAQKKRHALKKKAAKKAALK